MKTEYLTSALLVLCSCMAERLEQPLVLAGYDGATGADARLGTDAPGQDALVPAEDATTSDLSAQAPDTTGDVEFSDTNDAIPVGSDVTQASEGVGPLDTNDAGSVENEIAQDSSDVGSSDTNDAIPVGGDVSQDSEDVGPLDTNDANSVENDISQDSSDVGSSDTNDAIPVGSDAIQTDAAVPGCGTCDDKNPCSKDECVAGSCQHTLLTGVACSDGNACTVNDGCATGKCSGMKAICDDGVACTKDACAPALGCTVTADDKACDDDNPCSADKCETKGCTHAPTGSACDDGSACTTKDVCAGLNCLGAATNCDDGNSCTKDSCVGKLGCSFSNLTGACQDGNACTADDVCKSGSCVAGKKLDCDDGNACTVDSCGLTGCAHKVASDGAACGAGVVCQGGVCGALCGNGKLDAGEQCDDGNAKLCDGCEQCQMRNVLKIQSTGYAVFSAPDPKVQSNELTVEAWFKIDASAGASMSQYILDTRAPEAPSKPGFGLNVDVDSIQFWLSDEPSDFQSNSIQAAKWHHIAGVFFGGKKQVYVDGVLVGVLSTAKLPIWSSVDLGRIGQSTFGTKNEQFTGQIDQVRVSKVARYTNNFTASRTLIPDNKTVWLWNMDQLNVLGAELKGDAKLVPDTCYGVPPDAAACGDGKKAVFEACDDGNTKDGDGCSATCTLP